jgi:hypothetical protein
MGKNKLSKSKKRKIRAKAIADTLLAMNQKEKENNIPQQQLSTNVDLAAVKSIGKKVRVPRNKPATAKQLAAQQRMVQNQRKAQARRKELMESGADPSLWKGAAAWHNIQREISQLNKGTPIVNTAQQKVSTSPAIPIQKEEKQKQKQPKIKMYSSSSSDEDSD